MLSLTEVAFPDLPDRILKKKKKERKSIFVTKCYALAHFCCFTLHRNKRNLVVRDLVAGNEDALMLRNT